MCFCLLTHSPSVFGPRQDNMVKSNIDKKFSAHYDAVEAELKSSTVGTFRGEKATNAPRCDLLVYIHRLNAWP